MEKKYYSIRIVPEIEPGTDAQGAPNKPVYIRKTNPTGAVAALKDEDGNPLFPAQRTMHLELFEEDENYALGGDVKPFTLNIFENSDTLLFDKIEEMVNDNKQHDIMMTKRQTMKLNEKLPGLVRTRVCPEYKAFFINRKTGKLEYLKATRRQANGDFEKEIVTLTKVQYFLFANQVNEDDDAVRYATEVARVRPHMTGGGTDDNVVETAKKEAEEKVDNSNVQQLNVEPMPGQQQAAAAGGN